jgi:hypothetical protein
VTVAGGMICTKGRPPRRQVILHIHCGPCFAVGHLCDVDQPEIAGICVSCGLLLGVCHRRATLPVERLALLFDFVRHRPNVQQAGLCQSRYEHVELVDRARP